MTCPQCQQSASDGAHFCANCGLSLAAWDTPTKLDEPLPGAPLLDPLIDQVLDEKYRLLARLGQGGMGTVYRAQRLHIGDEVAVKILRPEFFSDAATLERFRREARAAAQLQHPNVVRIYDYGEAKAEHAPAFIVMELIVGTPLRGLLQKEGRLPARRAIALMSGVCAGVGAAHRRQIIHRDLKPDNVMVVPGAEGESERAVVVDFGIAKLRDDLTKGHDITQTGALFGTPYYMSPEQCRGESLDARADVYSLGAMLYEMLVGISPFAAPNIADLIARHLNEAPPALPPLPGVTPALDAAIMRALAKEREARQADAAAFAKDIQTTSAAADTSSYAPTVKTDASVVVPTTPVTSSPLTATVTPSGVGRYIFKLGSNRSCQMSLVVASFAFLMVGGGIFSLMYTRLANKPLETSSRNTNANPAPLPSDPSHSNTANNNSSMTDVSHLRFAARRVITHDIDLYQVTLSPDGQTVAAASGEQVIRRWRVSDGTELRKLEGPTLVARTVALSRDGRIIAGGSEDGAIYVWNMADDQLLRKLSGATGDFLMLRFSRDSRTIASVSTTANEGKTVSFWDLDAGTPTRTLAFKADDRILDINPDGGLVALWGDKEELRVWSVTKNDVLIRLAGHDYDVTCGVFSPDQRLFAVGSDHGAVRIWQLSDGALQTARGPNAGIVSVAFSDDGKLLATGWKNGMIRLYRVADGKLFQELNTGSEADVNSVAFSGDGRALAGSSDDRKVRLWQR